jgi:hypothetical protein
VVSEALRTHRKRCVERALAAGASLPADAFVFARPTAPDGSAAWSPTSASAGFARLRDRVPGAEGVRGHDLRHWLAAKTLGESKRGQQYQSIVPSVPTSATVCRSPIRPCSAIGR